MAGMPKGLAGENLRPDVTSALVSSVDPNRLLNDEAEIERLAVELHGEMERLDPVGSDWGELEEHDRQFCRLLIEHILRRL